METTLDTLCKGYPIEFKEYMEYCRSLKFEEEPDYKFCISLFDKCMRRHTLDPKLNDFTWKQNRLSKDKEALKNSMMDVIKKKQKDPKPSVVPRESGIAGGMTSALNTNNDNGFGAAMQ